MRITTIFRSTYIKINFQYDCSNKKVKVRYKTSTDNNLPMFLLKEERAVILGIQY